MTLERQERWRPCRANVVAALAHGADGVWVGTRLVASEEAFAHPEWKRRIVGARRQDEYSAALVEHSRTLRRHSAALCEHSAREVRL